MVFKKTRELAEALLESEAYLNMRAAEGKAAQNPEASQLMDVFVEKRNEIQEAMQAEDPDPGALRRLADEIDEMQDRLSMMDEIVEMNAARAEFTNLINQINQVLQFIVTGEMSESSSGCGGGCGGCRGCRH